MLQGRLFFYTNKHRHRLDAPPRILRSTNRMHRTPAAAVARARCAPTATTGAREIRSHEQVHHRDDNSGQRDIGVSNANQF
jgi:hypothetical protein